MANFRIYNETLCPELWDSAQHLDPEVRLNLLQMARDFYEKTNLPAPIIDVYLMGSIANYNWTADSDVDVHVIVNYTKLQMPAETANKTVKTAGAQWNLEHEVTIKGHKVEMNIQNSSEQKPYVTGVYSLFSDQWIRKPFKMSVKIDRSILKTQYDAMKKYVQSAISSGNREQMKGVKKYLDAYRQYGLDTYGELSYENVIFKILRSRGLIKQLKDSITAIYDKEMTVDEVGMKDLKARLPQSPSDYRYTDAGELRMDKMTMDNLVALRAKAARSMAFHQKHEDQQQLARATSEFNRYSAEIKRRMEYINRPITESPLMTKKGKTALAGDKPLRELPLEDIRGNIVVFREPRENQMLAKGFTLVYFMDSDESAAAMKAGQIPYLMVPRGTFHSGGSPITDIWSKRFQRPGTEHILGVIEGMTDENIIYIEMITVRPGWKRNHIAKAMQDVLRKDFPNAKITTSSRTDAGEKLAKGTGISDEKPEVKEGYGSGIPEKDRLKIKNTDGSTRRWQIRSKDAPKTPKMTDEVVIAVPEYDEPQRGNCLTEGLILESPDQKKLKKNRKPLSDEERAEVMKRGAVWHHGPNGEETPAVWKSVVNGKTWYCCNTHRAIQIKPTLKGAIKAFEFIKTTA